MSTTHVALRAGTRINHCHEGYDLPATLGVCLLWPSTRPLSTLCLNMQRFHVLVTPHVRIGESLVILAHSLAGVLPNSVLPRLEKSILPLEYRIGIASNMENRPRNMLGSILIRSQESGVVGCRWGVNWLSSSWQPILLLPLL
jgi:hypothetical protein